MGKGHKAHDLPYRPCVGIVVFNKDGLVWVGQRIAEKQSEYSNSPFRWQMPQGGIDKNEDPKAASLRELHEETGLKPQHVEIIGSTQSWLKYNLPKRFIRKNSFPLCIGQKQIWYLLRLIGSDEDVNLNSSKKPEFDGWRWIDFRQPVDEVVFFKRKVYKRALTELSGFLLSAGLLGFLGHQ